MEKRSEDLVTMNNQVVLPSNLDDRALCFVVKVGSRWVDRAIEDEHLRAAWRYE